MPNSKTFFILPTTIYQPDDFIQLGQVITDPRKPFERLAKPLPLEGSLKPRISPEVEWRATNTKAAEASVGVFAQFINLITAEASSNQPQSEAHSWEAALLETHHFEISHDLAYVERTARQAEVEEWLKRFRSKGKSVYMVTGLKIAKNSGRVTYDSSGAENLAANFQARLDPEGAVRVGGHANQQKDAATTQEARPTTAFIYAYRLCKLKVSWYNNRLKKKVYGVGADLYGTGHGQTDDEEDEEDENDISRFEMQSVSVYEGDFGASLPAKDKKIEAVDEDDDRSCLVIGVRV